MSQTEHTPPADPVPVPAPAPAPAPVRADAPVRHRPRFGTIGWGALLLGLATFMVARTLAPAAIDPARWLLAAVVAVGLVLVVAGIAAAVRSARPPG
ncbi:MAG: hypothetical protein R6W83_04945 [Cryobacterium sp.]